MYDMILLDPPWSYNSKGTSKKFKVGAENHYPTMPMNDLRTLPIQKIANPEGSLCLMWVTWPFLSEGLELMQAYGFKYRTTACVWVKLEKRGFTHPTKDKNYADDAAYVWYHPTQLFHKRFFGVGSYAVSNTEFMLLGISGKKNKFAYKSRKHVKSQLIHAPLSDHSRKPAESYQLIDQIWGTDHKRIELFCRRPYEGWDGIGNQIESGEQLDIREGLQRLIEQNTSSLDNIP